MTRGNTIWDVMPSFADLAGIDIPDGMDGFSVLPTLLGREQAAHESLYWEFYNPFQQAVRIGKWKRIRLGTEEAIHLFDLSQDLEETTDLAEEHPEIVQQIVRSWKRNMRRTSIGQLWRASQKSIGWIFSDQ